MKPLFTMLLFFFLIDCSDNSNQDENWRFLLKIKMMLEMKDIRGSVDHRDEKIGRKIRDAEVGKIPFMLVAGEKEAAEGKVSVRRQGQGDLGSMTIEEFSQYFQELVEKEMLANN